MIYIFLTIIIIELAFLIRKQPESVKLVEKAYNSLKNKIIDQTVQFIDPISDQEKINKVFKQK